MTIQVFGQNVLHFWHTLLIGRQEEHLQKELLRHLSTAQNSSIIKMTQTKVNSVLFDPGYAQHTTILSMSSEYIYAQINQFKNMNQRKMKFKMLFPQLVRMSDNNVGFCLGSLLWAVYIKSLGDNIEIEGNPCIGGTYDEAETVEEADFSIAFFEKLNKDSKYYLGKEYKYDESGDATTCLGTRGYAAPE